MNKNKTDLKSKYSEILKKNLKNIPKIVFDLIDEIKNKGGKSYLIGGFVRDILLGKTSKDIDMEVFGLLPNELEIIVKNFGKVSEVGKSFGILKLFYDTGEIDISIPRKDSKIGSGHKGFAINTNPFMSLKEAAKRRDFTINSISYDPLNNKLYDPFKGINDLENRILRVTDPHKFGEDPLRILRGIQFAARFELVVEKESKIIMHNMVPRVKELPKERIIQEWNKLLLKSTKPSIGLELAKEIGLLQELHPELLVLANTQQDPLWHPEGNVWIHTLKCIDAATHIIRREKIDEKIAFIIMLSVLCHDLGKPLTTQKKKGRIVSPEHQEAGEIPTQHFLNSIGADNFTKSKVIPLVKNHLVPFLLYGSEFKRREKITDGAIRRLATRLFPATIYELILVAEADYYGKGRRKINTSIEFKQGKWLLKRSEALKVKDNKPENIIQGKDLIALGFKPGKIFGEIIDLSNKLRDEKNYIKKEIINTINDCKNGNEAKNKLEEKLVN